MKAKREHRIPLSAQAVTLLRQQKEAYPMSLVFPGAKVKDGKQSPLSDMSLTDVLRRMERNDITVHGFRSCFRDCSRIDRIPHEMVEMALAHTIGNKVEAAYRRGDLFEKRRRMMQDWCDFCDLKTASADNVIPINTAA